MMIKYRVVSLVTLVIAAVIVLRFLSHSLATPEASARKAGMSPTPLPPSSTSGTATSWRMHESELLRSAVTAAAQGLGSRRTICVSGYKKRMASLFVGERLTRYGSGLWRYTWRKSPPCPMRVSVPSLGPPGSNATVTWIAGDEFCKRGKLASAAAADPAGLGFRQYWRRGDGVWNASSSTAYLPLGPRFEFQQVEPAELSAHPAALRPLSFNFMGTTFTSPGRLRLVEILSRNSTREALPGLVHAVKRWGRNPEREESPYMHPAGSPKLLSALL